MSQMLFDRNVRVTIESANHRGIFDLKDFEINFEVPFSDQPKPNQSKIEIFNLAQSSINQIKEKSKVTIQAGYKGDTGIITSGKVISVNTQRNGVDKITTILILDGADYSNKTGEITFKANTSARTIITRLADRMGLKIAHISLPRNKSYKKGYSVSGELMNALEEIVRDCGASIYYRRGSMVIRNIKQGDDERFVLEANTGLLDSPERFEEEDVKGYRIKSLLQHRIATASIIELKALYVKGKYRSRSGKHVCDGSTFTTEADVI